MSKKTRKQGKILLTHIANKRKAENLSISVEFFNEQKKKIIIYMANNVYGKMSNFVRNKEMKINTQQGTLSHLAD